jgi:hypothetical protein
MNVKQWFHSQYIACTVENVWAWALCWRVDNNHHLANFDELWNKITTLPEFEPLHTQIMQRFIAEPSNSPPAKDYSHMENITPPLQDWFASKMVHDYEFRSYVSRRVGLHAPAYAGDLGRHLSEFRGLWVYISGKSALTSLYREISAKYNREITWVERAPQWTVEMVHKVRNRQTDIDSGSTSSSSINGSGANASSTAMSTTSSTSSSSTSSSRSSSSAYAFPRPVTQTKTCNVPKSYCERKTKTRLQEEINSWRKTLQVCVSTVAQCAVCMDNVCNVVYSPCRHMICCNCAYVVFVTAEKKNCHMCGQEVHSIKNALL